MVKKEGVSDVYVCGIATDVCVGKTIDQARLTACLYKYEVTVVQCSDSVCTYKHIKITPQLHIKWPLLSC